MSGLNRRQVVGRGVAVALAAAAAKTFSPTKSDAQATTQPSQKPPPLDRDMVRDFVVAAHTDLEKTKTMFAAEPRVINATWDWGGGDFETALGGASHMGRPDIAAFLLANGARMDVFCATMMGKIEVVRACVADNPAVIGVKGPHGISLLRHATAGKQDAVAALLTSAGAK